MQNDITNSHDRGFMKYMPSPLLEESVDYGYDSLYSSIFSPNPSLFPVMPADYFTDDDSITTTTVDYAQPLDFTSSQSQLLINRQQDLIERQNLVLSQLCETTKQVEALRQENSNLRATNFKLYNRFSLLLRSSPLQNYTAPPHDCVSSFPSSAADSLANDFNRMGIEAKATTDRYAWDEISSDDLESPTSVIEELDRVDNNDTNRVSLPKSISVRSNGYLQTIQAGGSRGGRGRVPKRVKNVNGTQRVYVPGGKKEEQPLELEVYNQGMFKTELCNKWQQTGACPYGDHCQFAHGIEELRPVLRHPRYKTEVCRMVLTGDLCPYGHRCHFRHTLTDEERLMASSLKFRAL